MRDVPSGPGAGRANLRRAGLVTGALIVLLGIVWAVHSVLSGPDTSRKKAQQITLLKLPPPPPPKPPDKPPDPPKPKEEVKVDTPKPVDAPPDPVQNNDPPPGPLGVDAQGSGPGDGFGLAARPGGRDITASRGGGLAFATFSSGAARWVAQELARTQRLREREYRVELLIWLAKDGRIDRFEIVRGSGDSETDRLVREGLAQLGQLRQPVPDNLPQPLRVRVTSSDA